MEIKKLNDICLNITDGTHSTVIDDPNGECYLLSCKNIKDGQLIISNSDRKISLDTLLQLRRRTKMENNDVALTTVGTIGESCIVMNSNCFEFQRSVAILKPNSKYIFSKYLHYYFKSKTGQLSIKSRIKGAAQPCLFLNDLKSLELRVPSILVQQHIVNTKQRSKKYVLFN